jgi:DNA-binding CsgD family transcriptional regulator
MRQLDADEQAVVYVIQRESAAFWTRDEAAFASCHADGPDSLRWGYWQAGGIFRRQGSAGILAASIAHMRAMRRPLPEFAAARIDNLVIHVSGDMAWASFDRVMPYVPDVFGDGPNGTIHLLCILERIGGRWLIVVTTLIDAHLGDEVAVRVDTGARVTWTGRNAAARLVDDPAFVIRAGRLRLRNGRLNARLQSAIAWAAGLGGPLMPRRGAVPLVVENAPGATRVAWILSDDVGQALVLLDDIRPFSDRIDHAAQVFGLSPAQATVALALCEGRPLTEHARSTGISMNTARTHLRRVVDKTGVSSQPALVATLLSLTPPR